MVIGLLVISAIPTTIGVCQALSAQKKANNAAKEKNKFHLTATVCLKDEGPVECWCVLKEGRIWLDHPDYPVPAHKFTGYYFTYPSEEKHLGLVSTIADDPPMLNWIYADKDSHMLCHGGRQATLGHIIGPWYWSDDEQWLTLKGGAKDFIAVQTETGNWAIAWDPDGRIRGSAAQAEEETGDSDSEEEKQEEEKDQGSETVDHQDGNGRQDRERGGSKKAAPKKLNWMPILLHRRLQFGMESKYVKGEGENK